MAQEEQPFFDNYWQTRIFDPKYALSQWQYWRFNIWQYMALLQCPSIYSMSREQASDEWMFAFVPRFLETLSVIAARRGSMSRSAHSPMLPHLLTTRLHCCRLEPSPSLSISRPVCLWTSWNIATTNLNKVMCQYAYVSIHNASHHNALATLTHLTGQVINIATMPTQ